MAKQLVRLWQRPTYDGKKYTFYLVYYDADGRRRQKALGHSDRRKAERQQAQLERELRMGTVEPNSMKLSEFLKDSLMKTRRQVKSSTLTEHRMAMEHFIRVIGDIDYQRVQHSHGERFLQACLDDGNAPATAVKKLKQLKRLFQLAVDRGQLEQNPLKCVRSPKIPRKNVRVYNENECSRLMKAAREYQDRNEVNWELLIHLALCTGMRRGELLNLTWRDIDFDKKIVYVSPKEDTVYTWEWHIKDTDRRTLPLTDEVVQLLVDHQNQQPDGYPYVFVPPFRYDHIQKRREKGSWTVDDGRCPINNFGTRFKTRRTKAGIDKGEFHDLRRTYLKNLLENGMTEYEVMKLAGHSSFETTHRFYLAVSDQLLQRARTATAKAMAGNSVAKLLQEPSDGQNKKGCQPQTTDSQGLINYAREDSNL